MSSGKNVRFFVFSLFVIGIVLARNILHLTPGGPISDNINKLRDEFSAEKKKLDDVRQKKWEETKVQRDKEREKLAAIREEKNKQWEARKAERAKVEDAKVPYEDELGHCEQLIDYLNSLLPKKTAAATTTTTAAAPEASDVTILKKDDDEGEFAGKKKVKKQKAVKVSIKSINTRCPICTVLTRLIGYSRSQAQCRSLLTV